MFGSGHFKPKKDCVSSSAAGIGPIAGPNVGPLDLDEPDTEGCPPKRSDKVVLSDSSPVKSELVAVEGNNEFNPLIWNNKTQ